MAVLLNLEIIGDHYDPNVKLYSLTFRISIKVKYFLFYCSTLSF